MTLNILETALDKDIVTMETNRNLHMPYSWASFQMTLSFSEIVNDTSIARPPYNTIQYNTSKFLTRPTCQFASESGALRWRQKQLWVAGFKQFSFKPVLKCQKRIS